MIARSNKRRRRAATATPAAPDDASSSSWASLQGDLVRLIGWRLMDDTPGGDLLGYVRLRAVCTHWRSSTARPSIADARFHPRRWMMLPEGHGLHPGHGKLQGYVRFINLTTGTIVRAKLPLFRHHCVLDCADGLLLLQRDRDTAVRLLHPFTGDVAELPPLLTLVRRYWTDFDADKDDREARGVWFRFREVRSTCVSVGADGVITVMMVIKRIRRIAFATTVDHQWTVADDRTVKHVHRPISFRGRLYMLDYCSGTTRIIEIEPPRHGHDDASPVILPPPKLIATMPPTDPRALAFYLVECDSEILLIGLTEPLYQHVAVYRVAADLGNKLVPATSIGDDNVVMVSERTLSVSSRVLANVEGNSVVMAHCDDGRYPLFGQYQLGSNAWSPAAEGSGVYDVPSPCSLIYHIFTCCRPNLWQRDIVIAALQHILTRHGNPFPPCSSGFAVDLQVQGLQKCQNSERVLDAMPINVSRPLTP